MGFFISHLIFWVAIEIIFDPGIIHLRVNKLPTIKYDKNNASWEVPAYREVKSGIACLNTKGIKCLKGN